MNPETTADEFAQQILGVADLNAAIAAAGRAGLRVKMAAEAMRDAQREVQRQAGRVSEALEAATTGGELGVAAAATALEAAVVRKRTTLDAYRTLLATIADLR